MILLACALAAALVVVAALALAGADRGRRAAERRETRLLAFLEQQRADQLETLDRVMYAAGRPWNAPEPEPTERVHDVDREPIIVEEPTPGGQYLLDELDGNLFPGNEPDLFDLADPRTDPL